MLSLIVAIGGVVLARKLGQQRQSFPWGRRPVQRAEDGVGALFHRRYWIDVVGSKFNAAELMGQVKCDVGEFCPRLLADFTKSKGEPARMRVGDEYTIEILGPWNGDVRVAEVTETSFTFVTLEGHPEAGKITFAAKQLPGRQRALRFQISSWARSRDMLVSLGYNEGKIGKEIQKNAWVAFCERVAEASGGKPLDEVHVETEELDPEPASPRASA